MKQAMELLIVLLVVAVFSLFWSPFKRRTRQRRRLGTISGKAYVTDGDGIRVSRQEVRFSGLDAPEWNQLAKHQDGYWFAHGKHVKSALIQEIGGKYVQVTIEDYDKFRRAVGTVTCKGRDVGEWLVREGHAIAAYSDRYKHIEREARNAGRGMWGHAVNIDPREWRHREKLRTAAASRSRPPPPRPCARCLAGPFG